MDADQNRRQALGVLGALTTSAAAPAWSQSGQSEAYPNKPIRMLLPFPPGSGTDNSARIIGQQLTAQTGQPIVMDNRPGGNGFIAATAAAAAPPDGHTLFITTNTTHAANASLFRKLPYDPIKDFAPVSLIAKSGLVLVVPAGSPIRSVADLTALAKDRQGKLSFASGSSSTRISSELYLMQSGAKAVHVPYKGVPAALTDLVGGQVDFMISDIGPARALIRSGKLRAVAVTTAARHPQFAEVPTMAESGMPGYEMTAWVAAFLPAATPRPLVERMSVLIQKAVMSPGARESFEALGGEGVPSTPQELEAFVQSETLKWAKVVKAAGIEPE